jgi:hypothetical protein
MLAGRLQHQSRALEELTMRIAAATIASLLACASSEPPPPPAAKTVAAPHESAPPPTPSTTGAEISLSCVSGPTPPSAVDGRVGVETIIEVRHDFAMVRTRMNLPPNRAVVTTLAPDELARLRSLASAVVATPRPKATPPVPDGTACALRITIDGTTIDEAVDPTPPSGPLAELVVALRKRMTATEPTWPSATDPEIAACREAAKQPNIDRFEVSEIVIEADGTHRWMFLDAEEASTGNHFGCRVANGKPLILPEG